MIAILVVSMVQGVFAQQIIIKGTVKDLSLIHILTNYANLNLVDQLTRVPGVGAVDVMGAGDYSMRVWLNPETMRIRTITPQQVYAAIQSQNMDCLLYTSMATLKEFLKADRFATCAGVELLEIKPGYARACMEVTDRHLNGGGVCPLFG